MSLAEGTTTLREQCGTTSTRTAATLTHRGSPSSGAQLSYREEAVLTRQAQQGSSAAIERLVGAHMGLVGMIARRYRSRCYTHEDLLQEGILGLLQAVQRFDESRGYRLSTYAVFWIRQSIQRAVEQHDRMIRIPAQVAADIRQLAQAREDQRWQLGRSPSEQELAEATGIRPERVAELMRTVEDVVSLEAMLGQDQETNLLEMASDPSAPDPETLVLRGATGDHLARALGRLRPRERQVVEERFGLAGDNPMTLDQVSKRMHISRERVRQIERVAIQKLRYALEPAR